MFNKNQNQDNITKIDIYYWDLNISESEHLWEMTNMSPGNFETDLNLCPTQFEYADTQPELNGDPAYDQWIYLVNNSIEGPFLEVRLYLATDPLK